MQQLIQIIRRTLHDVYLLYTDGAFFKRLFFPSLRFVLGANILLALLIVSMIGQRSYYSDPLRIVELFLQPFSYVLNRGFLFLLGTLFGLGLIRLSEEKRESGGGELRKILGHIRGKEWGMALLFFVALVLYFALVQYFWPELRHGYPISSSTSKRIGIFLVNGLDIVFPLLLCLFLVILASREKGNEHVVSQDYWKPILTSLILLYTFNAFLDKIYEVQSSLNSPVLEMIVVAGSSEMASSTPSIRPVPLPSLPGQDDDSFRYQNMENRTADSYSLPLAYHLLIAWAVLESLFRLICVAFLLPAIVVCGISPLREASSSGGETGTSADNLSTIHS